MRLLEFFTRDPLLKLTALILAFLLWALVETGNRSESGTVLPVLPATEDSTQSQLGPDRNTRSVPVAVRLSGRPMAGWELAGPPRIEPPQLTVTGPLLRLERIDTLHLPTIRLDGRKTSEVIDLRIDTASLGLEITPTRVRVTIPIRQVQTESSGGGAAERPEPALASAGTQP